jgi:hypothetical protein
MNKNKTHPKEPQTRQLKLQPFYRSSTYGKTKVVPQLQLCGNWLEQAGFYPESYVNVIVREGILIIQTTPHTTTTPLLC